MFGLALFLALSTWVALLALPTLGLWALLLVTPVLLWRGTLTRSQRFGAVVIAAIPVGLAKLGWSLAIPSQLLLSAEAFREHLASVNRGISTDAAALVLGLTVGDDSQISKPILTGMQNLSLSHLTAVSGTNCTIVVLAAAALIGLTGIERKYRVSLAVMALLSYLWLVGPQPSVLRAGLMAIVVLIATYSGSRFSPRDVLGVAVLIALSLWPELAHSMGFALSTLATLAVLELAPRLSEKFETWLPKWLAMGFAIVISAQLACLPLLVWIQPKFSALAIVANLMAEPVVAAITLLGILGVLVSLAFPMLAQFVFWVASLPAAYLVALVSWLDNIGLELAQVPTAVSFAYAVTILVAVNLWLVGGKFLRITRPILAALTVLLLTAVVAPQLQQFRGVTANWSYLSCDVGQGDATLIRDSGQVALIDVGPEPKATNRCLRSAQVSAIDLLVLTHFDLDHVGGLAGVLAEHKVARVLLPRYRDTRPGAEVARRILELRGLTPSLVSFGDHGVLGGASWTVLNPPVAGQYLEDGNDASVSMRWDLPGYTALTLADLGEPGQMRLAATRAQWYGPEFRTKPLVMKVSHHGSADYYPELLEWLSPQLATISVGAGNSYGHPTARTLNTLLRSGAKTLRTDQLGSIAIESSDAGKLSWSVTGG